MKQKASGAPGGISAYLAAQTPEMRALLEPLVRAIRSAVPDAEEGTSYGLPAFRYHGKPLAAFAAGRAHVGYYPMSPAVIRDHAEELAGYATSKGAVQIKPGQRVPVTLIGKMVRARAAEIDA
jgi:uncharacterized protein YdhG (YjbR/CyaY superfamily)